MSKQIYKRQMAMLKVGDRWSVQAELQITLLHGSHSWFTESEFKDVKDALADSCYDRVIRNSEKSKDFLYKNDLLIVYEFQKVPGKIKNIPLVRIPDRFANTDVPKTRYGNYKRLPLYKEEKLVITVSLKEEKQKFKDKVDMDKSTQVTSKYFKKGNKTQPENAEEDNDFRKPTRAAGRRKLREITNAHEEVSTNSLENYTIPKKKRNSGQDSPTVNDPTIEACSTESKSKSKKKKVFPSRNKQTSKKHSESILELAYGNKVTDDTDEGVPKDILNKSTLLKTKKRKTPLDKPSTSKKTKHTATNKKNDKTTGKVSLVNDDFALDGPTISLEELIQSKDKDNEIRVMEDISVVAEPNETIDLEEYGNVSLEDVKSLTELSADQIRDLVRNMEGELKSIFKGRIFCERHEMYKQGGRDREALTMHVQFGKFSEEQEQALTKVLMEIFCGKKSTYFDYVMKVLLPETMIMIHQKVTGANRKDAEKAFDW